MTYTALELARAAGLFVVIDHDRDGLSVADGVAFVGRGTDHSDLACQAVRLAAPHLDEAGVAAEVARLGHAYRPPTVE